MYYNNLKTIGYYNGVIPDINNKILKEHIMQTGQPYMTGDFVGTRYEDTKFPTHQEFDKIIKHIRDQWMFRYTQHLILIDHWAHIHEKNMSTMTHNHVNTKDFKDQMHMSGVYYVQVPKDSGHLVLIYPDNQYTTSQYHITPEESMFCLFPSTMSHHVTRNFSDEQRVSVSFNFQINQIMKAKNES